MQRSSFPAVLHSHLSSALSLSSLRYTHTITLYSSQLCSLFSTMSASSGSTSDNKQVFKTHFSWDPSQYLRFSDARERPALELIARLKKRIDTDEKQGKQSHIDKVLDLGCGTGKMLFQLGNNFPTATSLIGIDGSADMLATARKDLASNQTLQASFKDKKIEFIQANFADKFVKEGEEVDILFTNAALHWAKQHETLFPNVLSQVKSGGYFACQIPNNFGQPTHTIIQHLMFEGKRTKDGQPFFTKEQAEAVWKNQPQAAKPEDSILPFYHSIMLPHCLDVDIWQTTYLHVLPKNTSLHPAVEWTKGTVLIPVLEALAKYNDDANNNNNNNKADHKEPVMSSQELMDDFTQQYSQICHTKYPLVTLHDQSQAATVDFRRIFMVAVKK